MKPGQRVSASVLMVALALTLTGYWRPPSARAADQDLGPWTVGGAIGFLGSTPDGIALALNFRVEPDRALRAGEILARGPEHREPIEADRASRYRVRARRFSSGRYLLADPARHRYGLCADRQDKADPILIPASGLVLERWPASRSASASDRSGDL